MKLVPRLEIYIYYDTRSQMLRAFMRRAVRARALLLLRVLASSSSADVTFGVVQ
jgi:hypothetical protein